MNIGIPKEVKIHEYRVAVTPAIAASLVNSGHKVFIEKNAGEGSGFTDSDYKTQGATIVNDAAQAWNQTCVFKVKDPIEQEYSYLREDLILFTFLHLAANPSLLDVLLKSKTTAVAYETVQKDDGSLPILMPMSEIAGRLAAQMGAYYLSKFVGGSGLLLSGVPGVAAGKVVVIGGGTVGVNAARIAHGLGAEVTVLDVSHERMQYIDDIFGGQIQTLRSNFLTIKEILKTADILVGAVLVPGARAPKLVHREMISAMKKGSVVIDVAVDQGGCIETTKKTTHGNPVYMVDGVLHYGVANIPGAVPKTSTKALSNQTFDYMLKIANGGLDALLDKELLRGVNCYKGKITHKALAKTLNAGYSPF